jgi:DNA-binding MarR family transcriptional regulator
MTDFKKMFPSGAWCVEESVGYLLKRSQIKLAKAVDIVLARYDITHAQGSILLMLHSGQYSTAAELARELYIDSASITRMLDRLEKRGLIVRMPRSDDRRVINLKLSEEGDKLANQLPNLYGTVLSRNFVDFSAEEVALLKTLLRKFLATEVPAETGKQEAK